jgi:hypothetical protein
MPQMALVPAEFTIHPVMEIDRTFQSDCLLRAVQLEQPNASTQRVFASIRQASRPGAPARRCRRSANGAPDAPGMAGVRGSQQLTPTRSRGWRHARER